MKFAFLSKIRIGPAYSLPSLGCKTFLFLVFYLLGSLIFKNLFPLCLPFFPKVMGLSYSSTSGLLKAPRRIVVWRTDWIWWRVVAHKDHMILLLHAGHSFIELPFSVLCYLSASCVYNVCGTNRPCWLWQREWFDWNASVAHKPLSRTEYAS